MTEPHEFWLLCARAKRETENKELQMLIQALAELCSHHSYREKTPEEVYEAIKRHTEDIYQRA